VVICSNSREYLLITGQLSMIAGPTSKKGQPLINGAHVLRQNRIIGSTVMNEAKESNHFADSANSDIGVFHVRW
jgi:hypothetical protein